MEMTYEDMEEMKRLLDNNDIPYEYGYIYDEEMLHDGRYVEYRSGHYLILFGKTINCYEITEEDEKWNRG